MKRMTGLVLLLCGVVATSGRTQTQGDLMYPFKESSLGGLVKSASGEVLEGVVVRAKQPSSYIGYNVVSDSEGKYRFPVLKPGRYMVEIARADGLESEQQNVAIQTGQESRVDFTLRPPRFMEDQMTSVDWLRNIPGTPEQIELVSRNCIHCHTGMPMKFRFDQESWAKIIRLMLGKRIHSAQWGMDSRRSPDAKPDRELPGFEEKVQAIAGYMAQVRGPRPIDLSNAKLLPRPTGKSTRVMYTEYAIPYPNAELHDIAVEPRTGMVWWTDWRNPYIGRLDPITEEFKVWETPVPPGKEEVHPGAQEVDFDAEGNIWTSYSWTGGIMMFNPKTEKFFSWMFPDPNPRRLMNSTFDPKRGRMWFGTDDYYGKDEGGVYDVKTGEYKIFPKFPAYGEVTDSEGNHYGMLRGSSGSGPMSHIGRIDAETMERVDYPTPTPNAFPRRGDHDSKDRIWFAEYNVDQIGMFDPKTRKITEWKIPVPMATPYGTGVDRKTDMVWVQLYRPDRIVRLNPETSELTQFYLPERHIMARSPRGDIRSRMDHQIVWLGTLPRYGNGKLIKIEVW